MPKRLLHTATADKRLLTDRKERVQTVIQFVDPFPWVHGTLPEKMVYAELSRYSIPFLFLNDQTYSIPELDLVKEFQSDFIFPDLKLIIEVQGAYWHSQTKTIESDAYKFAIYESTGWQVRAWWDYEILASVAELIANEPLFRSYISNPVQYASSELSPIKRTKVDTSQGIRTMNSRRFQAKTVKVKRRTLRKGLFEYGK